MEAAAYLQPAPDHIIVLNYAEDRLTPNPRVLIVAVGDTIEFRKQGTAPAGHLLGITFDYPEFFSAASYKEGDKPVTVTRPVPAGAGTYKCGFSSSGEVLDPSSATPGGAIQVET